MIKSTSGRAATQLRVYMPLVRLERTLDGLNAPCCKAAGRYQASHLL